MIGTEQHRTVDVQDAQSVRAAIVGARHDGLRIAVRATGHGPAAPAHGTAVLDTSGMRQVLVDPDRRVARLGPGATWSEVIAAAAPFGLAPISGTHPTVGVTGFTLGGGVGWLSRLHGFAADSLLRAEVVTAQGDRLLAGPDRHADLFWALRGGGGNFGVVTALEVRLHPLTKAFGGVALFPADWAGETLAFFRDWIVRQPDELTVSATILATAPDPRIEGPVVAIRGLYAGDEDDARRLLRPLWRAAGTPLADGWHPMAYAECAAIGGTAPRGFELFRDLPDEVVERAVACVCGDEPSAAAIELRHWGGAMARHDAYAGPVGHRDVPFSLTIDGDHEAVRALAPFATGGSFLNFLHDQTRTGDAYTASNLTRLRDLKRVFDPDNVLGPVHNIAPSGVAAAVGLPRGLALA